MKRNKNPRKWDKPDNSPKNCGKPSRSCNVNNYRGGSRRDVATGMARSVAKDDKIKIAELLTLANMDSVQLSSTLTTNNSGFLNILVDRLSHNCIVLVIKIISKMCKSTMNSDTISVLSLSCQGMFKDQLQSFILELPIQTPFDPSAWYYWNDVDAFWNNLLVYVNTTMATVPSGAYNSLITTVNAVNYTFKNLKVSADLKHNFQTLNGELHSLKCVINKSRHDNFRTMSVYPTMHDVTKPERPILQRNKVKGPYTNVEHYLDVQFRLLREDFVAPLRESICAYLSHDTCAKTNDINIHNHVKFLGLSDIDGTCGNLVQFQVGKKDNMVEKSHRFMQGSLLCFTKDNFHTLLFCRIAARSPRNLTRGLLLVDFDNDMNNFEYTVEYIMVEYNIYFEPYYHVLKSMQRLHNFNFPMKKYIIDLDKSFMLPKYYNSSCLLKIGRHEVDPRRFATWPDGDELTLNDSQYEAYKAALTREFVIIQGPPGTGKTYLGLQIAKTLLVNREQRDCSGPILVISYTNHALDQFLEGILQYTEEIVRVGGQSKNERLSDCHIKMKRLRLDEEESKKFRDHRKEMTNVLDELKTEEDLLTDTYKYDGIINFAYFINIIPGLQKTWFTYADPKEIINWLLNDFEIHENVYYVTNEIDTAEPSTESIEEEIFDGINRSENYIDYDDIDYKFITRNIEYYLKCSDMQASVYNINRKIEQCDPEAYFYQWWLQMEANELEKKLRCLKKRLREGQMIPPGRPNFINLNEPFLMHPSDRWKLYFYWLELLRTYLIRHRKDLVMNYKCKKGKYERNRDLLDVNIMKKNAIVGMTTTCAARLNTALQLLQCPIVIVEEAAEILESHIVASLTKHCKHLILIGDHQQLRPSTANYIVETKYKLCISLFERMVMNEISCNTLEVQHRMRPAIANLITPAIYPLLKNHKSVYKFKNVRGISTSLYFITHQHPEERYNTSKTNPYEAEYLLQLARYLIQNGYKPSDITILSAYLGQLFTLLNKRKEIGLLEDVNIKVLDNYQGEESEIILLSLVRNNCDNKIGFLSIENRVCVALSRARKGLYIMGNMNLLCNNSTIWPKIRNVLENQNSLGNSLLLRCQNHKSTTVIENPVDFEKVINGGCTIFCEHELACGHTCELKCHPDDHRLYQCKELCEKLLPCGHVQNILCFIDPKTHKCPELVSVQFSCTHVVDQPCHFQKARCPVDCRKELNCGHLCRMKCHINNDPDHLKYKCLERCTKFRIGCTAEAKHVCTRPCSDECIPYYVRVQKMRICQHLDEVHCSANVDEEMCRKDCEKMLTCGHPCKLRCHESCGKCLVVVEKQLPSCQHKIKVACSIEPTRNMCWNKCRLILACGHRCQNLCNEPCSKLCSVLVNNSFGAECGHTFKIPCHFKADMTTAIGKIQQFCQEPCKIVLLCGHICTGTCLECYQGRIHKTCSEICNRILICGHKCRKRCGEICEGCPKLCIYTCEHMNENTKKPVSMCKEPCSRNCQHQKCDAKCGRICTVPPCKECCTNILVCGHRCIGFCGDPCPQLCSICNKDELSSFHSKLENEDHLKLVLLRECGHVFESEHLENLLKHQNPIEVKRCPKCDVPLTKTNRYKEHINKTINYIAEVSQVFRGAYKTNENLRGALAMKVNTICASSLHNHSKSYLKLAQNLQENLKPSKKKSRQLPVCTTTLPKVLVFEKISVLFDEYNGQEDKKCIDYANYLVEALFLKDQLTNQEIKDFKCELKRFEQILLLSDMQRTCDMPLNSAPLMRKLYSTKMYIEETTINDEIEKLCDMISYEKKIIVTENEIMEQVGLNAGVWFKCRNGHISSKSRSIDVSICTICGKF